MDKTAFFNAVRRSLFSGRLSQPQVDGIEALLRAFDRNGVEDPRHAANILAQVYHETGRYMSPIKETVFESHNDKNPSDATVIARLDRAFANGQLPWVRTVYWRDGWFGRGMIQITHRTNYVKLGKRLGLDLVGNPDLTLDLDVSADIAVVGMMEGKFTGNKLAHYFSGEANKVANARRIVNGPDGTDSDVARYHRSFLAALQEAGWEPGSAEPVPETPEVPDAAPEAPKGIPDDLMDTIKKRFGPAAMAIATVVFFILQALEII